ncbi:MAG: hypothetical protein K8F91_14250 [Candidatus Obscuribacterales bacterium]|nr:hypothetical protein [Candidatus Obscuribacterales bacterium]
MNPGAIIVLVLVLTGIAFLIRAIWIVRQGARIESAFRKGMDFEDVTSRLNCSRTIVHKHCQRFARNNTYIACVDTWMATHKEEV